MLKNVTIVGGGIAGSALALSLSKLPLAITLIESGELYKSPPSQWSNRVSSITPSSASLLQSIGAWDSIAKKNGYSYMNVWDGVDHGLVEFDSSLNMRNFNMGWIIENGWIQHALVESLKAKENVTVLNRTKVALESKDGYPLVVFENGESIQSQLLVGADGFASGVRKHAGINTYGWSYNVHGLVATLQTERNEGNVAYQRFLPTGPIAYLPLGPEHASLVWTLPPDAAKKLSLISPTAFAQLVNAAFTNDRQDVTFLLSQIKPDGSLLCDFGEETKWGKSRSQIPSNIPTVPSILDVLENSRASFPLRLQNADRYTASRIALIGDAAHTVHPLAGQGLNLGLADVASLTESIEWALSTGQDIGTLEFIVGQAHVLSRYASDRYAKTVAMMVGIDTISKLFSTDNALLSWVRSTGLGLTNAFHPLKSALVKIAS